MYKVPVVTMTSFLKLYIALNLGNYFKTLLSSEIGSYLLLLKTALTYTTSNATYLSIDTETFLKKKALLEYLSGYRSVMSLMQPITVSHLAVCTEAASHPNRWFLACRMHQNDKEAC